MDDFLYNLISLDPLKHLAVGAIPTTDAIVITYSLQIPLLVQQFFVMLPTSIAIGAFSISALLS